MLLHIREDRIGGRTRHDMPLGSESCLLHSQGRAFKVGIRKVGDSLIGCCRRPIYMQEPNRHIQRTPKHPHIRQNLIS